MLRASNYVPTPIFQLMAVHRTYQEHEVLNELAQGNQAAFKQVYNLYWYSIYKTARRYTRSEALAEDIVQEIFETLWSKRSNFREVIHLEYYLITMTKNLTYRTLRRIAFEEAAKNKLPAEGMCETEGENHLLDEQYDQLLRQAVGLLPMQQKQVFQLAKVDGLSHSDIASQLKISPLTVKAHMAKALRFIRHYLQPHVDTYLLCAVLFRFLL